MLIVALLYTFSVFGVNEILLLTYLLTYLLTGYELLLRVVDWLIVKIYCCLSFSVAV